MNQTKNKYALPVPQAGIKRIARYESPAHKGMLRNCIDFIVPTGTPVKAAASGIVVDLKKGSKTGGRSRRFEPLGNFITIKHANEEYSEYEHLSRVLVRIGQRVRRGQPIGKSGATGWLANLGPHLHFMVGRYVYMRALKVRWDKPSIKIKCLVE
ncbi:M23 family metallopeptidase [archaeon]|nr:M23 family metallopeptidase [archaeon]